MMCFINGSIFFFIFILLSIISEVTVSKHCALYHQTCLVIFIANLAATSLYHDKCTTSWFIIPC